jgi:hypothetical protein
VAQLKVAHGAQVKSLFHLSSREMPRFRRKKAAMARKKSKPLESGYALFDVFYEDGSRSSNRRVPRTLLGGLDGDQPAHDAIQEQDNAIAEKAGRAPVPIKKIVRADG